MEKLKLSGTFIEMIKAQMREALASLYISPLELKNTTFEVQVITRYDADTQEKYTDTKVAVDSSIFTEHYFSGLHGGLFTLIMAIVGHAGKDGFAFPSVATLSQQTGLSERTIKRYLDDYANKEINGRVLVYKMNFTKAQNHTVSLYYVPDCKVSYLDELDIMTEDDKSNEVSTIGRTVFNPLSANMS